MQNGPLEHSTRKDKVLSNKEFESYITSFKFTTVISGFGCILYWKLIANKNSKKEKKVSLHHFNPCMGHVLLKENIILSIIPMK